MEIYWLILIAIGFVVLQSIIVKVRGLKHVQYERSFSVNVCREGDQIEMIESIRNQSWLPIPWIRLETAMSAHLQFEQQENFEIDAGSLFQNHKSLFSLMPYTEITRRHRVTCKQRGVYLFESVSISYGDLIGLHSGSQTKQMDLQLIVYPMPAILNKAALPSSSLLGEQTVKRWVYDDPFMVRGIRQYEPGDPYRFINWPATARTGKLQVLQRDFTADPHLLVCLNVEIHEKMWRQVTEPKRIESGIRIVAGWVQAAIENGWEVGVGCNGYAWGDESKSPIRTACRSGAGHQRYLSEMMARIEIERSVPFDLFLEEELRTVRENTDYVLITAFVSEKIREVLNQMQASGHHVTVIPLVEE